MPLTDDQVRAAKTTATPPPLPVNATPTPQPQALPSHAVDATGTTAKAMAMKLLTPFLPVATGAARVAGTGVGKVIDVLNRPSAANQARLLHGPAAGATTLAHSTSPEQYQADTAEIARRDMANDRAFNVMPLVPSFGPRIGKAMTKDEYDKMPGWWHQAVELETQIRHDPLTYAGGAGILEHLGSAIASRSAVAFSRAVDAMLTHSNPEIRAAGKGLAAAYDATHYKGATQRALAAKHGEEGLHYFRGLKAINNARRTKGSALGHELLQQYDDVTKGLSPIEESKLYEAIHKGTVENLKDPNLTMRAAAFKKITDSLAHLEGTEAVQRLLKEGTEKVTPGKNVFRWQSTPDEVETSPLRGSTYFYEGDYSKVNQHIRDEYDGRGKKLVQAYIDSKNPLQLRPQGQRELGDEALKAMRAKGLQMLDLISGPEVQGEIDTAWRLGRGKQNAARYLRSFGVPNDQIQEIIGKRTSSTAIDRIASELAKRRGHDAIVMPWDDEFDRQSHEAGGFSKIPYDEVKPPDEISVLDPNIIKRGTVPPPVRTGGGFELPKRLKPFESETPRGLQGTESYRESYVPTKHAIKKEVEKAPADSLLARDQTATADTRSLSEILRSPIEEAERTTPGLKSEDANLLQRGEGAKLLGPQLQRKVIEARLKGGAQAIAAHDAEAQVAKLFGKDAWAKVPNDAKAFFQETWKEPGGAEFWGGLFKKAIDIPKAALFALPFRHMANIASLSFLADPSLAQTFGTAGRFMRLILARDPEVRAKIMGKAGQYGIGASSFDRRPGWVGQIPLLGSIYKASNHTLWTFDDAAKATRFDRLLKKFTADGMDEAHAAYQAADRVGAEMVDYSNSSPLTEILRYIFPFASWRTKFPLAVAGSVGRHPEVAANIGRVSPEMVGDVQQEPGVTPYGEQKGGKSNLPLAEAFRGVENPWEFGRAALGYPAQMAASALGIHDDDYKNYMTYGKDPDLKFLLNATLGQFPGASAGLGAAGLGEFASQGDMSGTVGQQLGLSSTHGPSPQQLETAQYVQNQLAEINAANKAGQPALAKSLEGDLKYYLKSHELYEK